jgi:putative peptide zinc metalloprotease protein
MPSESIDFSKDERLAELPGTVRLYAKSADIDVAQMDTLYPDPCVLVRRGTKYYRCHGVSRAILLCFRQEERLTRDAIAQRLSAHCDCSAETLDRILKRLQYEGMLECCSEPAASNKRSKRSRSYLAIRIPLLPPKLLRPVTRFLAPLFSKPVFHSILPALAILNLVLGAFLWRSPAGVIRALHGSDFAWLAAGNYLALLMHELGHASACIAAGLRHGAIGVCIYLFCPAFYADTTRVWEASREQRTIVDAGGIYTTLMCASVSGLIAVLCHSPAATGVWLLCILTVLWNLNPFIRMDGYWILSDILGIDNLMAYNRQVSKWVWKAIRGCRTEDTPFVFMPSYRYRNLYVLYYGFFLVFFAWMGSQMLFHYYPHLFRSEYSLWIKLQAHSSAKELAASLSTTGLRLLLGLIPLFWIFRRLVHAIPRQVRKAKARREWAESDGSVQRNASGDRALAG